ncbi:hypothetical protein SHKM778_77960 [Streptomyces sp. KM77-8]|uniref:Uncharacterized protein n=1 Tax=Streptomyces haneummycinicus TaxID=3074435 RepID=A0AAT9HVW8_9ACTN
MSVIGATLVRVTDVSDFDEYVADADQARDQGTFTEFVTSPSVQLADLSALGAGPACDGPRTRLYAGPSGSLSTSPGGAPLGHVGDELAALDTRFDAINAGSPHPCAVGLGDRVPEDVRTKALAERPWLGRYLAAIDAVRELRARGVDEVRVSGFGHRLWAASAEVARPADATDPTVPLLLWTDETAYVHCRAPGRTFQLDLAAGILAEALLVNGSVEEANRYADHAQLVQVERFFADAGIRLTASEAWGTPR